MEREVQRHQKVVREAAAHPAWQQSAGANGRWGGNGVGVVTLDTEGVVLAELDALGRRVAGGEDPVQLLQQHTPALPSLFHLYVEAGALAALQLAHAQAAPTAILAADGATAPWSRDLGKESDWYRTLKTLRARVNEATPDGVILLALIAVEDLPQLGFYER